MCRDVFTVKVYESIWEVGEVYQHLRMLKLVNLLKSESCSQKSTPKIILKNDGPRFTFKMIG